MGPALLKQAKLINAHWASLPVHRALKFSAVFGTVLPKSPMTMRPAGMDVGDMRLEGGNIQLVLSLGARPSC